MDFNNFGGFAILGSIVAAVTATWGYVKTLGHRVVGLVFWRAEVDWLTHRAIVFYLYNNAKLWGNRDRQYNSSGCYIDARVFYQVLERIGDTSLIFYGRKGLIFLSASKQKGDNSDSPPSAKSARAIGSTLPTHSLTGFRHFGISPDKLIAEALAAVEGRIDGEEDIVGRDSLSYRWVGVTKMVADHNGDWVSPQSSFRTGGTNWINGDLRLVRQIPTGVAPTPVIDSTMRELVKEAKLWKEQRDWYKRVGLAWRRGWLLYGPPGGGKTKVAEIVAHELNVRLVDLNLAGLSDAGFRGAWSSMEGEDCRVVLIEEFDTIFKGRELQVAKSEVPAIGQIGVGKGYQNDAPMGAYSGAPRPLRFETILTTLGGARSMCEGTFLIITTNHPELIDPALGGWFGKEKPESLDDLQRPGRIDRVIEIGKASRDMKRQLIDRCLDNEQDKKEMLEIIDCNHTVAVWQELLLRKAMIRMRLTTESAPALPPEMI